ncbi:type III secretion system chaperone [Peristeroidobacter soli]|uniref:type III secretion system chaperone n=1 Tax=Peristeroidobacter soli TaxID=2497877 RepID=UPI00101C2852|nr:type III secretion system chaperone [Peristeroidobacter soli]
MIDLSEQAFALMKALGDNFGLELHPDETGACAIRIDDRVDVTLRYEPSPPALLAYAPVGELPSGGVEAVLRGLLAANHIWDGSRGATWSLSGNEVILSRLFVLEGLEVEPLAAELAVFVEVALAEQQALQSTAPASPAAFEVPLAMGAMLPRGAIAP